VGATAQRSVRLHARVGTCHLLEVTWLNRSVKRLVFWTPRILCIVYAVFVSLFALDVFGEGNGLGQTVLALLMHLIPTAVIVVVLAVSWRREWLAAVVFIAAGVLYLFSNLEHVDWVLVISGPLWLIGIFFLVNWLFRRELRAGS